MPDNNNKKQETVRNVACNAVNCVYNDTSSKKCVADHITVGGYDSTSKLDTFCATFTDKK